MRRRGLTLIESVLGISLLSLVLLSLWNIFLSSNLAMSHARLMREGGDLAQGFLGVACAQPYGTYAPDSTLTLGPITGSQPFEAELRVTAPEPYLKQMSVRVTWTERNLTRSQERSALVVDVAP